jgi:hypothetical protein
MIVMHKKSTLAALVLALAHRETAVSGFSTLKNDTELCFRARVSNAFHLHCYMCRNIRKYIKHT